MKIGLIDLLTIALVVLKLLDKIHISWLLVFTPLIVVNVMLILVFFLVAAAKIHGGKK